MGLKAVPPQAAVCHAPPAMLPPAERFVEETRVGEGTYAVVYKGTDKTTGRTVAIKKIHTKLMRDKSDMGMDLSAIREISALQCLRHPNIVELLHTYRHKRNIVLVLEYLDNDLEKIMKNKGIVFQQPDVKSWMIMMMRGVAWCHKHWILHRDLKPNNLLIGSDGLLKLADFGLARQFADVPRQAVPMTVQVITLWYRPPELLMAAREYSYGIDIWSAGCIFAELMLRTPLFPGKSEIDQLTLIFRGLGTPSKEDWPGIDTLPGYLAWPKQDAPPLRSLFTAADDQALDLLGQMLKFDPWQRPPADRLLEHPYFTSLPLPTLPHLLPRPQQAQGADFRSTTRNAAVNRGPGDHANFSFERPSSFLQKMARIQKED